MQKWYSIRNYTSDYLNLVYRFYASHGRSYIGTYYNLDLPNSTTDKKILDAGPYEVAGPLSGLLWKKITMLPVYNIDQVTVNYDGNEKGMVADQQMTTLNFPTTYEIQPNVNDVIYFEEQIVKNDKQLTPPTLQVVNFEKAINSGFTFWKLYVRIFHISREILDKQLSGLYTFVDYEKAIYSMDDSLLELQAIDKNSVITNNINTFYRKNAGLYFV